MNKSKEVPFERVLFAIGIRYVGDTVAKKLARYFKSIDSLIDSSAEQLTEAPEVGEKIAESVVDYFKNRKNIDIIERLKKAGLQFAIDEDSLTASRREIKRNDHCCNRYVEKL